MNEIRPNRSPSAGDAWEPTLESISAWLDDGGDPATLDRVFAATDPALHPRIARILDAIADGACAPDPRGPSATTKDRLLERLHATDAMRSPDPVQVWRRWREPTSGADVIRGATDGPWEKTAIAGIDVRRLFVDRAAGRVTMLVRMAAGTTYPRHRHGGAEECFVISGDLRHGERVMNAGDFEVVHEGSIHEVQSTATGCVLLIRSSLTDEILAA